MKKKLILLVTLIAMMLVSGTAFAQFTDISENSNYSDAVKELADYGIMNGYNDGSFKPDEMMTREQFATVMVVAAGLADESNTMKGAAYFPDVSSDSWSCGFINMAVKKGYITGMSDGKFHPNENINFAQACTVMVRALGYSDTDLTGLWPIKYIEKARNLDMTDDINLNAEQSVPRWAVALMIDRVLDTNVKKSTTNEADKTFGQVSGFTDTSSNLEYSKPYIAADFDPSLKKLGDIQLESNMSVLRNSYDYTTSPATVKNGENITLDQIESNDVIYLVINKLNNKKYILVVDNKVEGEITGITPDRNSPKSIQIDKTSYDLGKYFDTKKIGNAPGAFNTGMDVTLLVGYDGKAADIINTLNEDASNYAFVLNYDTVRSKDLEDYEQKTYYLKLLLTDGTTATYVLDSKEVTPDNYKGRLIKYEKIANDTTDSSDDAIKVTKVEYSNNSEVNIDKAESKINSYYIADNIKIFDITSNYIGMDAQVDLVDWSTLPHGVLPAEKVLYMSTTGEFSDVNILVLNDVFDTDYALAVVNSTSGTTISGDKSYNLSLKSDIYVGDVYRVELNNTTVIGYSSKTADVESDTVQAVDYKRVKINDAAYRFNNKIKIYEKDVYGRLAIKGTNDIVVGMKYTKVSLYLDKQGKAEALVLIR